MAVWVLIGRDGTHILRVGRDGARTRGVGRDGTHNLVSLDALGAGSISPDPKDVVSVLPKVTGFAPPDLEDAGSVASDGDPYRRQPLQVQVYGPGSKL